MVVIIVNQEDTHVDTMHEEAIEFCKRASRPIKLRKFNNMSYLHFLHHDCCDYCADNDY